MIIETDYDVVIVWTNIVSIVTLLLTNNRLNIKPSFPFDICGDNDAFMCRHSFIFDAY